MEAESLYNAIEKALSKNGLNLYGAWDKISYDTKMHNCEKLVQSGGWEDLPTEIVEYVRENSEVLA